MRDEHCSGSSIVTLHSILGMNKLVDRSENYIAVNTLQVCHCLWLCSTHEAPLLPSVHHKTNNFITSCASWPDQ